MHLCERWRGPGGTGIGRGSFSIGGERIATIDVPEWLVEWCRPL